MKMRKKVILANAFSLSMLPSQPETLIKVSEISEEQVKQLLSEGFDSAVGHESTANFLSKKLSVEIKPNRKQIKLDDDTLLIVVQLMQRLPEGKVLSEEEISRIPVKFYIVHAMSDIERCFARACYEREQWARRISDFIETKDLSLLTEDSFNPDCNKCISRDECTDDEVNEAMKRRFCPFFIPRE